MARRIDCESVAIRYRNINQRLKISITFGRKGGSELEENIAKRLNEN